MHALEFNEIKSVGGGDNPGMGPYDATGSSSTTFFSICWVAPIEVNDRSIRFCLSLIK